ncbi:hypothetical protein L873DRAFT_1168489 [Choiromyces venosus 120613-1]|uniref:Uncharacterized protein n=1 Tax=Choiromyces venosus 120613-1 TaxID=1336337 RepID=A0A3N4K8H0_9PEZI|nr:hypothetical protein L873DRAFT_1168489 [Choiromyces venosus 120613-1]
MQSDSRPPARPPLLSPLDARCMSLTLNGKQVRRSTVSIALLLSYHLWGCRGMVGSDLFLISQSCFRCLVNLAVGLWGSKRVREPNFASSKHGKSET